jgi:hypothetical protein
MSVVSGRQALENMGPSLRMVNLCDQAAQALNTQCTEWTESQLIEPVVELKNKK